MMKGTCRKILTAALGLGIAALVLFQPLPVAMAANASGTGAQIVANADIGSGAEQPAKGEVSMLEAGESGAAALEKVFGLTLDGKKLEMSYFAASGIISSKWFGEYWVSGKKGPDQPLYCFTVDAKTGDVWAVQSVRVLTVKANLGYDAALAKNPAAAEAVAKQYAEDLDAVGGKVKTSAIDAQGYQGNVPTVSFRIVGENGKMASIEISRHDQALLAISYNDYVVENDAHIAQMEREVEEISRKLREEQANGAISYDPNKGPEFIAFE